MPAIVRSISPGGKVAPEKSGCVQEQAKAAFPKNWPWPDDSLRPARIPQFHSQIAEGSIQGWDPKWSLRS